MRYIVNVAYHVDDEHDIWSRPFDTERASDTYIERLRLLAADSNATAHVTEHYVPRIHDNDDDMTVIKVTISNI